jgi:saccharopine dehydrogenase (NAD+, L-lysine-forming)
MNKLKIGLIREGKIPPDKRVAFTPLQAEEVEQRFPHVKVLCETSSIRCFQDQEYKALDIEVTENVGDCDILMGIKEVPVSSLIPGKTYLFFSHTLKKQPYNRKLLQAALEKKIRLIDYEALKDKLGNRLVAFGRYAGIVGAYNGLWTYGNRYKKFSLRRAYECFDVNDLKLELEKVKLPPIKILLTGSGRVGKGAMETLDSARIRKVNIHDFLYKKFEQPVYIQLSSGDYHTRKAGGHFNREEFHHHPDRYFSNFVDFTKVTDLLLAGAYWNPKAPVLFTREDMLTSDFKIRIIADITCDINGSVPSTKRASTIPDPIYDYDPVMDALHPPFASESYVSVMAVDNLPCELPRSSSEEFGRDLIDRILQPLLTDDTDGIIERATITSNGRLTSHFAYLDDYAYGTDI